MPDTLDSLSKVDTELGSKTKYCYKILLARGNRQGRRYRTLSEAQNTIKPSMEVPFTTVFKNLANETSSLRVCVSPSECQS